MLDFGVNASPRGLLVKEIENYSFILPPYVRFASFESRKLNIAYIKKEFKRYLQGDRYDDSILDHAKIWSDVINEDGSINSNYGQYIFKGVNQFDRCVKYLKEDKDSRRAAMVILSRDHVLSVTADLPYTYSISFRIRENKLNMSVRMRSQDAIYGLGNDIPAFSIIHEMMFHMLTGAYPKLELGYYHHCADSFHVYSRHFEMLDKIVNGDTYLEINCPKISGEQEVGFLKNCNFTEIPESYEFTRWLLS